jgi:hypothetical protein
VIDILIDSKRIKPNRQKDQDIKKSNPSRFNLNKSDLESVNANIHGFQPGPSR